MRPQTRRKNPQHRLHRLSRAHSPTAPYLVGAHPVGERAWRTSYRPPIKTYKLNQIRDIHPQEVRIYK